MPSPNGPFHIVTTLQETRGNEHHAQALCELLRQQGETVTLWSDQHTADVARFGGRTIQAFSAQFPRGGTLIILGTWTSLLPWIDYARPRRLIVICNTSNTSSLLAQLATLERPGLPVAELVFVSRRLQQAAKLPGMITPILVDPDIFRPAATRPAAFTIGRLSRDIPEKHHRDDASLYRMLAWNGCQIRIMGGTCIASAVGTHAAIRVTPINQQPGPDFLRSLDVFFYRTDPSYHEAAGRVVMESLMSGLPVIAHTNGGYTDWIKQGENGYLFSSQEEAWEYLKMLQSDTSRWKRLAEQARASALILAGPQARQAYADWLLGNTSSIAS